MAFNSNRKTNAFENIESMVLPKDTSHSKSPFFLMIHPRHGWVWDNENSRWIPEASRLPISPGVAGTEAPQIRGQQANPDTAILAYQKKGFKILFDNNTYLKKWPKEGGGYFYTTIWDNAEEFYDVLTWNFDKEGYTSFLLNKIKEGIIPEMHPKLKEFKITDYQKRVDRLEKAAKDNPISAIKHRYEASKATLEAMKKDLGGRKNG